MKEMQKVYLWKIDKQTVKNKAEAEKQPKQTSRCRALTGVGVQREPTRAPRKGQTMYDWFAKSARIAQDAMVDRL